MTALRWAPVFLAGALAFGQASKLAPELQHADPDSTVRVIVQYKQDPTDAQHRKVTSLGGTLLRTLHSLKAAVYSLPASALAELAKDPDVVHISADHAVSPNAGGAKASVITRLLLRTTARG